MDCLKLSITEMASKGLAKNHRTGTGEFPGFFSSKRETIRQRVRGTIAGKEAVCLTACLNTAVRFDDATHISAKKKSTFSVIKKKRIQTTIMVVAVSREAGGEVVLKCRPRESRESDCPWHTCTADRQYRSAAG